VLRVRAIGAPVKMFRRQDEWRLSVRVQPYLFFDGRYGEAPEFYQIC